MLISHKTIQRIRRDGTTTVEFAVVAPVFFTVIFFCFEFARMSMMRNLAQNAAYEACRFAMMEGATEEDGEERANAVLARLGTTGATVTTTFEPVLRSDGTVAQEKAFVTTTVTIPVGDNAIALPSSIFGNSVLSAETQLRSERYLGFFETQAAPDSTP